MSEWRGSIIIEFVLSEGEREDEGGGDLKFNRNAPEGRVIYSGNVSNCGRDISNLCRREPVAMVNGATFLVLSALKTGINRFLI